MIIAKVIIPNIIATFFMFFLNSGLIFIILAILIYLITTIAKLRMPAETIDDIEL